MSRLDIKLSKPKANIRAFDIYMVFLYHRDQDTDAIINEFLIHLVTRVRSQDEYEPDPTDVQHVGSDNVTLEWYGHFWSIDDFIALLLDTDKVEAKNAFLEEYHNEGFSDNIEMAQEYRYYTTEVVENEFTLALLHDSILSSAPQRQFLKRYLFWLSVHLDTRVERLSCKLNNVLINLSLSGPPPIKVRNMRKALGSILLQYAYGHCSQLEFDTLLRAAYENGFELPHEPDIASEEPHSDCLFDCTETRFEEHDGPWLMIRYDSGESNAIEVDET